MTNHISIYVLGLAVFAWLALSSCQARDASATVPQQPPSLASKLLLAQPRARTARSLSDMFEKVKNKIFGSKKQSAASAASNQQIQAASSANAAQRQPWGDLSALGSSQFGNYPTLTSANYQSWAQNPSNSPAVNQFLSQQYNPMGQYISQASYPSMVSAGSGLDGQQLQGSAQQASGLSSAVNQASPSSGTSGILSSASHLIAQYLSPNSSPSAAASSSLPSIGQQPQQQSGSQNGQSSQQNSLIGSQQQAQYNEFASILDSMVAQTGAASPVRQSSIGQYGSLSPQQQSGNSQQQPQQQGYQQGYQGANMMGAAGVAPSVSPSSSSSGADVDMSASSSVQSYLPASQQQATQKSSMVSLAEQLAPGANFNKLISFPFSLSNNDDPAKEGRYKLHIPFLNQHVKRSDQQQRVQQQQQQQQQQQMLMMPSQVMPTIVSQQASSSVASSGPQQYQQQQQQSAPVSSQQAGSMQSAVAVPQSNPSASVSLIQSQSASPISSSASNQRPAWSVADLQSSQPSSSKLIPIQSAAAPSNSASSSVSSSSSSSSASIVEQPAESRS